MNDSFTKTGATRLASQILMFWTARGLSGVKTWIEPMIELENETIFQVRSNVTDRLQHIVNSDRYASL